MTTVRTALWMVCVLGVLGRGSVGAETASDPNSGSKRRVSPQFEEQCRKAQLRSAEKALRLEGQLQQSSTAEDRGRIKRDLAKTYENLNGRGEDARRTYADILENDKGYSKCYEVAYRLAELHHYVELPGTKSDYGKAVKYYEEALRICPADCLVRQQAHLSLGLISWRQKEMDKAIRNIEAAYRFDPSVLRIEGEGGSAQGREERLKVLRGRSERMRDQACRFLIVVQEDPSDPARTIEVLDELEKKYGGDPKLVAVIQNERDMAAKKGQRQIPQMNSVLTFPGGVKGDEVAPTK